MPPLTGRQILLLLAVAAALALVGVGVYVLVRGPGEPGGTIPVNHLVARPDGAPASIAPAESLEQRALPHTTDPIAYAKAVAVSLFDRDTSSGYLPSDYSAVVLADADPSGEETPGLVDDAATYLPTTEQWLDLGAMKVVQSIEIDDALVPRSWPAAVEQAHGTPRPGTTAVTVAGTRHRRGVWKGEVAESSYPVSFTVFVACPPGFDRCHVLRLSQLDKPLR